MFRTTFTRTLRLARPLSTSAPHNTAVGTINKRVGQTLASGLGRAQHAMEEAAKPDDTGFPTPEADAAAASPINMIPPEVLSKTRAFADDATGFLTPEAEEAAVAAEAYTTPSQSASATSTGFAQAKEPTGGTGHR